MQTNKSVDTVDPRVQEFVDKAAIAEIMQNWRWRDLGNWDKMRTIFHPEGTIRISWFQGLFKDFVDASMRMTDGNTRFKHNIGNTTTQIKGNRAIAETDVLAFSCAELHGLPVRLTFCGTFFDLVEKRNGVWRVLKREGIYDVDLIAPENPSDNLSLDPNELAKYPEAYRFLGYFLASRGFPVNPDLLTRNSPAEAKIREEAEIWLSED